MGLRLLGSRLRAATHDLYILWHPVNLQRRFWRFCCRRQGIQVVSTDAGGRPGPGDPDYRVYRGDETIGSVARRSYRNPDLPDDGTWWIVSPAGLRRGGFGRPEQAALTLARGARRIPLNR